MSRTEVCDGTSRNAKAPQHYKKEKKNISALHLQSQNIFFSSSLQELLRVLVTPAKAKLCPYLTGIPPHL